ncbi:MAG: hypothetical protein ACQER1_05950, partial [Armatimonadota bacterium]
MRVPARLLNICMVLLIASTPLLANDLTNGITQVRALHRQARYADAIDLATTLATAHPDSALPHAWLGLAQNASGDAEAAMASANRAIELDEALPLAWMLRGALYQASGQAEAVRGDWQQCLLLCGQAVIAGDGVAQAYWIAGIVQRMAGDAEKAL